MRNSSKLLILVLLTFAQVAPISAQEQAQPVAVEPKGTIGGVYYFGCDGSFLNEIKAVMPVHSGQPFSMTDSQILKGKISNAVRQVIFCSPTDVAIVNCGVGVINLYIGLPGRSVVSSKHNPLPVEKISLPAEGISLYEKLMRTLVEQMSLKNSVEDQSKGYALSEDKKLRQSQLTFREWALSHKKIVVKVLQSSSNAYHRAVAAEALGYVDPSAEQVQELLLASNDDDRVVRNNSIRALGCIAGAKPKLVPMIPLDGFIRLLNSDEWTDRNKAIFIVQTLCKNNPNALESLRKGARESLAEMSCWDDGHAWAARTLVIRLIKQ